MLQRHIFKFPREKSHYTLGKKESLNPDLDVKQMWALYKKQEDDADRRVLGYGRYLQEFNKYDLKFGSYKLDTCSKCDTIQNQRDIHPENETLKIVQANHLRHADVAFKMQKHDMENTDPRTASVWGDMMSVQQIPKLSTGAAFYKRKYKVYNEDFYLANTKQHHMYLWGQEEGKKGANDVISCLHKCIETIPDVCKHLICWFDNTSSQLKNVSTLLYLLHRTDSESPLFRFERICLKYAPPGHTFMPPDRAFGNVSKQMKKKKVIGDPYELMDLINEKCKNSTAMWLEREQHFDWGKYLAQFYEVDRNFMRVDQEPLLMKSRWFSFGWSQLPLDAMSGQSVLVQQYPNEIKSRMSLDMSNNWKSFRVEQKRSHTTAAFDTFIAYPDILKLDKKRIRDLCKQKEWLPEKYRDLDIYNLEEDDGSSSSEESE
jgi:hypothetical protein